MNDLQIFKEKLNAAKDLLILLASDPSMDTVAAALALFLSLKESGKSVSIVGSTPSIVRDSHLVGLDLIGTSLGGTNLVMTINADGESVDKVTSSTDNGKLSLTIIPKAGFTAIKSDQISFSYSGASADLVIVMGAGQLADIGDFATREAEFLSRTPIINISNINGTFGIANITDTSSLSELATAIIQETALTMNADIGSNLMLGIQSATNNLTSATMTADTFEALAILTRSGAKRASMPVASTATIVNNIPIIDHKLETDFVSPKSKGSEVKKDWLGPKIFKGSNN